MSRVRATTRQSIESAVDESASGFSMRVVSVVDVPGRGLSVAGVSEQGAVPQSGSVVTIWVADRRMTEATVSSGPITEAQAPTCGFLLRGASAADVPIGARITSAL